MRKKLPLDLDLANMIDPSQPVQIIAIYAIYKVKKKPWLVLPFFFFFFFVVGGLEDHWL